MTSTCILISLWLQSHLFCHTVTFTDICTCTITWWCHLCVNCIDFTTSHHMSVLLVWKCVYIGMPTVVNCVDFTTYHQMSVLLVWKCVYIRMPIVVGANFDQCFVMIIVSENDSWMSLVLNLGWMWHINNTCILKSIFLSSAS